MMSNILISDATLRDGNHAVRHQLSRDNIKKYCIAANAANIPIVEVGHGNGIGASSVQVGLAKETDRTLLSTAREYLTTSKLGIHVIPGFATVKKDLIPAVEMGVDVFRIASHCTEADVTAKHIAFAREQGKEVYGVLMMSHMASVKTLVEEAQKMESYGAEAIVIMDSAGAYLGRDVQERICALREGLNCQIGFHGHNNLGLAISNSLIAAQNGATIIDGCARGFGAGAGNSQLEVLIPVFEKEGFSTGIDLYKALDAADLAEKELMKVVPTISSTSIVSGLSGVFSGYLMRVNKVASEYGVDPRDIFFKLGEKKVVAGQEDMIIEVAQELLTQRKI
ncbi:4-hydroxy-2-oxovalerate aldolase [Vibrio neptunius]|uniref:4-hydroxy-2-oxovalerate aldolase n=1 Tax=Vibrio neptunius TaxID=170651 RepID=A0ABS3A2X3_9VIBR|nr:4-hydroxy-2-oxovalerate aldolase [Vibrio neptunius]MBN3493427.1 4-hydroxy-2-oxovalerate aldolase [Vibrio neptunius]MBN3515879.1 4-hydroxy-2-oxovalerate aldolase [Vibrio neptunius]MBN3550096.1 4-hydroxy-2-oxovalerate aldolase [Vibrio neptunius]MBN3578184.1 4-hydroxy-2-oxovalerate aldolase [Vibrio neptunius]MCH9871848.1 4-hydroxy-2-oxovalerate aldolase [Vibrio neptunius]